MDIIALSVTRERAGIPAPTADQPVWGIVAEWYMATDVVLLALCHGTSSMYFGYGGGVIGGHGHESVRDASAKLLAAANASVHLAQPSSDLALALPQRGHARFRVRTDAGMREIDALERDVKSASSPLHELLMASHESFAALQKRAGWLR